MFISYFLYCGKFIFFLVQLKHSPSISFSVHSKHSLLIRLIARTLSSSCCYSIGQPSPFSDGIQCPEGQQRFYLNGVPGSGLGCFPTLYKGKIWTHTSPFPPGFGFWRYQNRVLSFKKVGGILVRSSLCIVRAPEPKMHATAHLLTLFKFSHGVMNYVFSF